MHSQRILGPAPDPLGSAITMASERDPEMHQDSQGPRHDGAGNRGTAMEQHDTEGSAATAQGGTAPKAPYVRPVLTELSVGATLSGDPTFPREGFFSSDGVQEATEVGPDS